MDKFINSINKTFIVDGRYKLFLTGIQNTIFISFCAAIIGITIGLIVAILRISAKNNRKLILIEKICSLYVTVIRGTPVVVQLLIMYFAIFVNVNNSVFVAIITFGINSGAYVAEIARAGIESVDKGQMEAGLSLGLSPKKTMIFIVLPQAFKNTLPALGNEFISLLKETAVAGYVPIIDLTKAGDIIRTRTYESAPLYFVAICYLIMVVGLTAVQKRVERRLSESDRN